MFDLTHFRVGDRVQLHPATDAWMMGDRYGEVTKIGRKVLHVRMDVSGKIRKVAPCNIGDILERPYVSYRDPRRFSSDCFDGRDPAREGREAAKDR